ncbi:MAG: DUF4180 domain-containing protein [Clostridia bacterium]|jgi:hypothetical protein|nr:DUF4180 domain-containing protein [Clostridia bacterium]MBT7122894.1 DUF4180 domain-containing protein [Clostridia bacterium]
MRIIREQATAVGIINSTTKIATAQGMLDIMATFGYTETSEHLALIVHSKSLSDQFLNLKSGIAGEILQKFSNYNMKLAIVGDFSAYPSKALQDFIRECNRGNRILFVDSVDIALSKLKQT